MSLKEYTGECVIQFTWKFINNSREYDVFAFSSREHLFSEDRSAYYASRLFDGVVLQKFDDNESEWIINFDTCSLRNYDSIVFLLHQDFHAKEEKIFFTNITDLMMYIDGDEYSISLEGCNEHTEAIELVRFIPCGYGWRVAITDKKFEDSEEWINYYIKNNWLNEIEWSCFPTFEQSGSDICTEEIIELILPKSTCVKKNNLLEDTRRKYIYSGIYDNREVNYCWYYNPLVDINDYYDEFKIKVKMKVDILGWIIGITPKCANGFGCVINKCSFEPANLENMPLKIKLLACRSLIITFAKIHSNGFCFQHIRLEDFWFNKNNGEIYLANVDEIGTIGMNYHILRNSYESAPEVFSSNSMPSIESDLHSLAVMIFEIIFRKHPLIEDKKRSIIMTHEIVKEILGNNPVYNHIIDESVIFEYKIPDEILDAFQYSFSRDVLKQYNGKFRINERRWLELIGDWYHCACGTTQEVF